MLVSGPAVLSALLVIQAAAELEAGARVDIRAGIAPTGMTSTGQVAQSEQKQVAVTATPLLGLRWSGGASESRAISATRILWRPVPLLGSRPLFLETLEASHLQRPSKRSRWQLSLRGSYGEEDYISLTQQFAKQPTLPAAMTMVTVNALADGLWRESRRTTMTLLLEGIHRQSLNSQTVASGDGTTTTPTTTVPVLPTQTLVTVRPGVRYALSRRSTLEALVGLTETDIQGIQLTASPAARVNVFTVQPQVGLLEDLSRRHQMRAFVGLTYAAVLVNPDKSRDWRPWTPLVRADLTSLLWRIRASAVRSTLGASTMWYADPVLAAAVLRGMAEARLDAQLGPRWSIGARGAFTTDFGKPLPPYSPGGVSPDETIVQVEVPVRYRWTGQIGLEFGGRYAERAPSLAASDFGWRNRELWAFLTLVTTTRRSPTRS
jgi:hypothetical protein